MDSSLWCSCPFCISQEWMAKHSSSSFSGHSASTCVPFSLVCSYLCRHYPVLTSKNISEQWTLFHIRAFLRKYHLLDEMDIQSIEAFEIDEEYGTYLYETKDIFLQLDIVQDLPNAFLKITSFVLIVYAPQ